MSWHAYSTSYIDWGWAALKSVEETRTYLDKHSEGLYGYDTLEDTTVAEFDDAYKNAMRLARGLGWEGDFRQGPVVFWIPVPDDNTFAYGFAWKQDNNGTMFIVSPVEMHWLTR